MSLTILDNRVIDEKGNIVYFDDALIELLYKGIKPEEALYPKDDEEVKLFNEFAYENFDDDKYMFPDKLKTIEERKHDWFYPKSYDEIVLEDYFLNLCNNDIEKDRVKLELKMFLERDMEKFLRFCIFFSDEMKKNNWVVGVGRGSSCACYLLYLLKIHLVNPLKYNLDIKEFLK